MSNLNFQSFFIAAELKYIECVPFDQIGGICKYFKERYLPKTVFLPFKLETLKKCIKSVIKFENNEPNAASRSQVSHIYIFYYYFYNVIWAYHRRYSYFLMEFLV